MSKKNRYRGQRQSSPMVKDSAPKVETPKVIAGVKTRDMYSNGLARLGANTASLVNASTYPLVRLTRDYALMTSLYRNDWISQRIIDYPAIDMVKGWIDIKSQIDPDAIKLLRAQDRKYRVRKKLIDALKWARLYGGAGALINIKGQEDMLDQPLDLDMVMPGSFRGLIVMDRWNGISPEAGLITDPDDPEFGLPEYYLMHGENILGSGVRVHHSRILRFIGRQLPTIEDQTEEHWGAAELEHVYEELNKRNSTSANIAQLIYQANLRYLKYQDFGSVLAMGDQQAVQEVYDTIKAQNQIMSSFGVQIMDQGDVIETHSYTFAGIADVYKLFMSDIAGAADIPATRLFGRSPEGMNATGESDLTNYYEGIHQKQESDLRPVLEKLLPVMCLSAFGAIPDDLDFDFNPIRSSSDKDRAALAQQKVAAIIQVFNSDLISKATAMKELRKMSSEIGMFDSITDEDIEAAEMEPDFPMGEGDVPGMGDYPQAEPEEPVQKVPGQVAPEKKPVPEVVDEKGQKPLFGEKVVPFQKPKKRILPWGGNRVG